MWDVSGITGAAPVWQEVMHYLHQRDGQKTFYAAPSIPADVLVRQIHYVNAIEGDRKELFLTGTEQVNISTVPSDAIVPKIRYPKAGMVVAVDPDIPPERQKLRFHVTGIQRAMLLLDGSRVPLSALKNTSIMPSTISTVPDHGMYYDWFPWPGKHVLSLVDMNGALLDQLTFEVRGAFALKASPR